MNRKPVYIDSESIIKVGSMLNELKTIKPPASVIKISRSGLVKLYAKQIEALIARGYSIKFIADSLSKSTNVEISAELLRQQVRVKSARSIQNKVIVKMGKDTKHDVKQDVKSGFVVPDQVTTPPKIKTVTIGD